MAVNFIQYLHMYEARVELVYIEACGIEYLQIDM